MRVELDVYSGRPNPSWELTNQQSAEFLKRLQALQAIPSDSSGFDGLGYRGFVVEAADGVPGGFEQVRVLHGKALGIRGSKTTAFGDPGSSLEAWLLETGRNHMQQGTMDYVSKEIRSR